MPAPSAHVKAAGATVLLLGVLLSSGCGGEADSPDPAPPTPPTSASCASAPSSTLTFNVKDAAYGAKGDGVADDTSAIQKAVNAAAGTGGTVTVPAGTYLINPTLNSGAGIRLKSNMRFVLDPGAVLKARSTSTSAYVVVLLSGVQDVVVRGGTIMGNRNNNTITDTTEAGTGLRIVNSRQIVVEGITARDCWADGFYIGSASQSVTLCGVIADNNRRHGMAITNASAVAVTGSTFKNTSGILENGVWVTGCGIDIEPNDGETVDNVRISGCTFSGNMAAGLAVGPPISLRGQAFVTKVTVDGNTASGNGTLDGAAGIEISNTSGHQIINNTAAGNIGYGIYLRNEANNNQITGNTVSGTKAAPAPGGIGYGIMLYQTGGNTVSGNTVTNSAACGIRDAYPTGTNTIGTNTLSNNNPNLCPP